MNGQHQPTPPLRDRPLLPDEAAELLGVPVEQLLDDAAHRRVPGVCLGGEWRFSKRRIQRLAKTAV